ncbi:hypothetical protein ZYGM_000348 [Zygosaccharomyces mellis]|uniref:Spc7 kinetochore protein domain-containing protein n=1 Tax=Zygosaccharomyces mellis TaxID=42258 RepID=A0A4C2EBS1_9SACH|nr:hypothetical protein ZYGM_000348 [Zygosaccharomyces mellis]
MDNDASASSLRKKKEVFMAKGILKSSQSEESQFVPELQLPNSSLSKEEVLESGNNTTSRINTLQLQNKISRRVSFAPDVTLHSFDFVPQVQDVKLPRRKEKRENNEETNLEGEESMELSQAGPVDDPEEEQGMTMTQVFKPSQEMEITEIFKPPQDEPMELTQLQRITENGDNESEQMELTQVPPRVHTPPAKKRKKMSGELREEDDMELSLMRMSPIALRGSDTKTPSSYSLKEFLDAVGVSFLIDTNFIKKQQAVEFPLAKLPVSLHSEQVLSKLYVDMPALEMNAFVCRELLRRVDQSNAQFQDLENQISSSVPPLLFREYFQSSEEMRRLMNQQLQLVKSFAKLESKKAWYDWRIQHFKGLQDVLLENLGLLQEEKSKLDKDLQRAQENKEETFNLLQILKKEVELLRDLPSQIYKKESKLTDKLQLERFRQELRAQKIAHNDSKKLQLRRNSLLAEIELKSKEADELKKKLLQLQRKDKTQVTDYDVAKLRRKLELLSTLSGIQFKGINNSQLFLKCFDRMEISIDLSLLQSSPQNACRLLGSTEPFYKEFLQYVLSQLQTTNDFLSDLVLQLRKLIPLIKTYLFLKNLFPLAISKVNGTTTIRLMDYDIRTDVKYIYKISMQELIVAVLDKDVTISVAVELSQKSNEIPLDEISTRFVSKVNRILSWANPKRIRMTI